VLTLFARTRFFAEGHAFSGLDPEQLGARSRYVGRGRVVAPGERSDRTPVGGEPDEPARMTIAERRAAQRAAAPTGVEGKDA